MNLPSEVNQALGKFMSGVAELEKILNAEGSDGSGPNMAAAGVALSITEPIAKICYPYVHYQSSPGGNQAIRPGYKIKATNLRGRRQSRTAPRQDLLKDIRANEAVAKLWKNHFDNKRYEQFNQLIWHCLRNGITHNQLGYKVVQTPHNEHFNSFLTGVAWVGMIKYLGISVFIEDAEREHLNFKIEKVNGKDRPAFIFSPHVYYFDLRRAVENIEKEVETNKALRGRIVNGWKIYDRSCKTDFGGFSPRLQQKIDHEIRKLNL